MTTKASAAKQNGRVIKGRPYMLKMKTVSTLATIPITTDPNDGRKT
jgi:hypothetical protein